MSAPSLEAPNSGIVSVEELAAYMGGASFVGTSKQYAAAQTLAGVQQELETYLGRPVQKVQIREVLVADTNNYLNPSVTPVQKVLSYTPINDFLDGFVIPDEPYPTNPMERDASMPDTGRMEDHAYPVVNAPLTRANGIYLGDYQNFMPGTHFFVEYIGGYDGYVDNGLKQAILRVAAREMSTNHDQTLNLRDGNPQTANAPDPRPRGWSDEELMKWDRLRRRTVA